MLSRYVAEKYSVKPKTAKIYLFYKCTISNIILLYIVTLDECLSLDVKGGAVTAGRKHVLKSTKGKYSERKTRHM